MKTTSIRNFHIPLPETLYQRLNEAAKRERRPATQLAKQAVEYWLSEQEKLAIHEEIAKYAAEMAGTEADLDEELEAAGVQHLIDAETGANWMSQSVDLAPKFSLK